MNEKPLMDKLSDLVNNNVYGDRYTFYIDKSIHDAYFYDDKEKKKYYLVDDEDMYYLCIKLNRQDSLIKMKQNHVGAMVNALHEEMEQADGELKGALVRISRKELEI